VVRNGNDITDEEKIFLHLLMNLPTEPDEFLKLFFINAGLSEDDTHQYRDFFNEIYLFATEVLTKREKDAKGNQIDRYFYLEPKKIDNIVNSKEYLGEPIRARSFDSSIPAPYTQHDLEHARRVSFYASKLLKMFSDSIFKDKISFNITPKYVFFFACACLVHDLGMWKTWLTWQIVRDDEKQRQIHGRLARIYLHQEKIRGNISLENMDIALIGDISELHQSSIFKSERQLFGSENGHGRKIYSKEVLLLGDILMLADAIDFNVKRSCIPSKTDTGTTSDNKILSPLADFEHGINKYVCGVILPSKIEKMTLNLTFCCTPEESWQPYRQQRFARLAKIYFHTYIKRQHIDRLYMFSKKRISHNGKRKEVDRYEMKALDLKIVMTYENKNKVSYGGLIKQIDYIEKWKPLKVWPGAFCNLDANKQVISNIKEIYYEVVKECEKEKGGVLVLLHDEVSDTLRYCLPQNLEEFTCGSFNLRTMNWDKYRATLREASQTIKCGISGYAYYCNSFRIISGSLDDDKASWSQDVQNMTMPGDEYFFECNTLITFPIPSETRKSVCGLFVILTADEIGNKHAIMNTIKSKIENGDINNISKWITQYACRSPYCAR